MSDELLSRVQARCPHEWQYTAGIGKQCARCALLWETWAEQRISALEALLQDELEEAATPASQMTFIWTFLPPQTEKTCGHCDGTGIEPFGGCSAVCLLCGVNYDADDVYALAEQNMNSILPCGHALSQIRLFYECQSCRGSGLKLS